MLVGFEAGATPWIGIRLGASLRWDGIQVLGEVGGGSSQDGLSSRLWCTVQPTALCSLPHSCNTRDLESAIQMQLEFAVSHLRSRIKKQSAGGKGCRLKTLRRLWLPMRMVRFFHLSLKYNM